MPLQSSPRRLAISLLLSALLLSTSFQGVIACEFKATPEKVAPGNGCQVHWDQTKPGNNGNGNHQSDTPGTGNVPNTQTRPSTNTRPGSTTGGNTVPTGGNNSNTSGRPSTGYTAPTNTGGTYTRPTVGTNTQTKPGYSQPDTGYTLSKPNYSHGPAIDQTSGFTKPSTGTNTATDTGTGNHDWSGYSKPVYGGAQSKPGYGSGGPSKSMPIYNSHTAQNQGVSQAITNLGPATTNVNNQNNQNINNQNNQNVNNQQNQNSNTVINNNSNNVNINTDYTEWKSTTVSLMTGVQGSGQLVAQIAVNVDMSSETGTYNIPQAPYLTCYGQSYYYKLVSSSNSVFFTDSFEISESSSSSSSTSNGNSNSPSRPNGPNIGLTSMNRPYSSPLPMSSGMAKLPMGGKPDVQADTENSGVCKDVKVKEHEGYTWGAINNFVYGYTIVQNITNIYNNVVTTVVEGQKTTTTVLSTVTKQATVPATTVTQSGGVVPSQQATTSVTSYKTITQTSVKTITPTGGADVKPITTTVTSYTVSHSGPPPSVSTAATDSGTTAPAVTSTQSGTTATPPGSSIASSGTAEAAQPTTAPALSGSKCTENDWDDSCEDWADEPSGVSSSAQADATGGANIDDLYGKAVGSPQVSYAVAALTAITAVLGGSALLLF